MGQQQVNHFTDLIAWKKAHVFVKLVYEITKKFPPTEQFGLTSQLRRAASSITANIAEGYGRYHFKDKHDSSTRLGVQILSVKTT